MTSKLPTNDIIQLKSLFYRKRAECDKYEIFIPRIERVDKQWDNDQLIS